MCLTSLGTLDSNNCVTAYNWRQSLSSPMSSTMKKKSISYLLRRVVSWNYFQTNFLHLAEFNRKKGMSCWKPLAACHPFTHHITPLYTQTQKKKPKKRRINTLTYAHTRALARTYIHDTWIRGFKTKRLFRVTFALLFTVWNNRVERVK